MTTPQTERVLIILRQEVRDNTLFNKHLTAARIQLAIEEIERLQAALAPFVKLSEQALLVDGRSTRPDDTGVFQINHTAITVGDCRRALKCQE